MMSEISTNSIQRYRPFENVKTVWKTTDIGWHTFNLPGDYDLQKLR